MSEQPNELKKLTAIATDLELPSELRRKAVEQLGRISTHEALLALLDLVANEGLIREERSRALKQASQILKSSR
jgi:HEAT repeat protein